MLDTGMLTKDLGTILVGHQAVEEGIIDRSGRHPGRRCKTSENDLYILTKYVILDLYACRFL